MWLCKFWSAIPYTRHTFRWRVLLLMCWIRIITSIYWHSRASFQFNSILFCRERTEHFFNTCCVCVCDTFIQIVCRCKDRTCFWQPEPVWNVERFGMWVCAVYFWNWERQKEEKRKAFDSQYAQYDQSIEEISKECMDEIISYSGIFKCFSVNWIVSHWNEDKNTNWNWL